MDLPQELQSQILARLDPRSLKAYMATCREARRLGQRHELWDRLRRCLGIAPPKARARRFRTSLDLLLPVLCRVCWGDRMQRGSGGVCTACLQEDATLWSLHALRREGRMSARRCEAWTKREQRQLARLQDQLRVAAEDLKCAVQEKCLA